MNPAPCTLHPEASCTLHEEQAECKTCPGGSTTEVASGRDEASDCILECAAGKYHDGEGVCAVCAAGSYKAAAGTELSCTDCEADTYQKDEEQAACTACPSGTLPRS